MKQVIHFTEFIGIFIWEKNCWLNAYLQTRDLCFSWWNQGLNIQTLTVVVLLLVPCWVVVLSESPGSNGAGPAALNVADWSNTKQSFAHPTLFKHCCTCTVKSYRSLHCVLICLICFPQLLEMQITNSAKRRFLDYSFRDGKVPGTFQQCGFH